MMKSQISKHPILIFLIYTIFLFACSTTMAITNGTSEKKVAFDITSKIYVDDQLVSSPRIVTPADQKATILISDRMMKKDHHISMSGSRLKLELLAKNMMTPEKKEAIKVSYNIRYQNNKTKIHVKPDIILVPNQESIVKISDAGHVCKIYALLKKRSIQ